MADIAPLTPRCGEPGATATLPAAHPQMKGNEALRAHRHSAATPRGRRNTQGWAAARRRPIGVATQQLVHGHSVAAQRRGGAAGCCKSLAAELQWSALRVVEAPPGLQ